MNATREGVKGDFTRRLRVLVLGALIACFGVVAFAGPAKAVPASMDLTNGQLNLGFAFKGAEILPAPQVLGADPDADPPVPGTPLPDLWDARTSFSAPGLFGGTPSSFRPAGCATPVTFGVYALTENTGTEEDPVVGDPIPGADPRPFANSGQIFTGNVTVGEEAIPFAVQTTPEANTEAPCDPNPASATVDADIEGGDVLIESPSDVTALTQYGSPSGFRFPIMIVPNPLDSSPVPVTIASTGDVTGTFDSNTGDVSLSGPIEARVLVGLTSDPLGQYCALPLVGLTLSTNSNADFPGIPFTSGFDGEGALTGTYNITENATSVGGADCGTVNAVSKGLGSIWLSNGIAEPPVCPEFTTGIPPNCEPIPCPSGFTGNEPNCVQLKANLRIARFGGPNLVRRYRAVIYRVRIRNTGNIPARGVRIRFRGRGVSANRWVGRIAPNTTRRVLVRVRFRQLGRVVVRLRVLSNNAGNRYARKVVRVRR